MNDNRRVLALMPHPDDMELLCAGTLLQLRERGCEIHVATMTPGDEGSAVMDAEVIADIRRAEGKRGAESIGAASYHCLEFRDCEVVFDNPSRHRVCDFMRKVAPFLVITTPPADYMMDHEETSRLVRDGCFNISLRNYGAAAPYEPLPIPYLYYTDPLGGRDILGRPALVTTVVDITHQMERKVEALVCHDSQRSWLLKQQGMDNYVESMRTWAATRGAEHGFAYAEAFCQHRGQGYPQDDIVAGMLSPAK